jgi:hypothetical protein
MVMMFNFMNFQVLNQIQGIVIIILSEYYRISLSLIFKKLILIRILPNKFIITSKQNFFLID